MTTIRQTLDQQRARFAWAAADDGMRSHAKEFRPLAKGASALVMGSGLMPTLAFLNGKRSEGAHAALLSSLCDWLSQRFTADQERDRDGAYESVMNRLHRGNSQHYMEATHEVLAILKWIRHYVDAVPSAKRARS